jgi:hypothetical protein
MKSLLLCIRILAAAALAEGDLSVGTTRPSNPEISGMTRAAGPRSEPTKTADYSGVSGPGQPMSGSGYGGYRTGREGVMYRGPDPKAGWLDFATTDLGRSYPRYVHLPCRRRLLLHDRFDRRQHLGSKRRRGAL